ncbi:MAG: sodium:proton antiporter [Planctomycetota bacterium]|nr:sodium:proton antiporter [Planctomycetota bacterium]
MEFFPLFSAVIVTAAAFSWLNHRYIGLPTSIGVMLIALVMSLGLIALELVGVDVRGPARELLVELDFKETLLDFMLAFLLFAGALHIDLDDLLGQKRIIALLATVGVLVTTFLVGGLIMLVTQALGFEVAFIHCLLFGALIAPTDPIAVLSILRSAKAPKSLATKIAGESLFNDGVGVVVFLIILGIATSDPGETVDVGDVGLLLAREVIGGLLLGFGAGWVTFRAMKAIDDHRVEVLCSLALAMGIYALAAALHSSGPLAVVVAGLFIGNTGRALAMSEHVREHLDTFWELIDEILNVTLFVLIGLELLLVDLSAGLLAAGVIAIPLVLFARFVSVSGTVLALQRRRTFTPHAIKIMTWGGLRGGISIALALSIGPEIGARDLILTMTYIVVIFSILVQGLTVGKLVRRIPKQG